MSAEILQPSSTFQRKVVFTSPKATTSQSTLASEAALFDIGNPKTLQKQAPDFEHDDIFGSQFYKHLLHFETTHVGQSGWGP